MHASIHTYNMVCIDLVMPSCMEMFYFPCAGACTGVCVRVSVCVCVACVSTAACACMHT